MGLLFEVPPAVVILTLNFPAGSWAWMVICLLPFEMTLAVVAKFPVEASYTDTLFILLKLVPVTISLTDPATAMVGEMEEIAGACNPVPVPEAALQIKGIRSRMTVESDASLIFFMAVLQTFFSLEAAKRFAFSLREEGSHETWSPDFGNPAILSLLTRPVALRPILTNGLRLSA
jgi:hypothetical protein